MADETTKRVVVNKAARKIVIQRKPVPSSTLEKSVDEENCKSLKEANEIDNSLSDVKPISEEQSCAFLAESAGGDESDKPKEPFFENVLAIGQDEPSKSPDVQCTTEKTSNVQILDDLTTIVQDEPEKFVDETCVIQIQEKFVATVQDDGSKPTVEKKLSALERLKALNFSAPKSGVNPFSLAAPTKSSGGSTVSSHTPVATTRAPAIAVATSESVFKRQTFNRPADVSTVTADSSSSKRQHNESSYQQQQQQQHRSSATTARPRTPNFNKRQRKQTKFSSHKDNNNDGRPKSLLDLDIPSVPPSMLHQQNSKNFPSYADSHINNFNNNSHPLPREFTSEMQQNARFFHEFAASSRQVSSPLPPLPPPTLIPPPPPPVSLFGNMPNLNNAAALIRFNNVVPPLGGAAVAMPLPLNLMDMRPQQQQQMPPFFQPLIDSLVNKEVWLNNPLVAGFACKDSLEREKLQSMQLTEADLNSLSLVGLKRTCEYFLEVQNELACQSNRLACQIKIVQRALDNGPKLPADYFERLKRLRNKPNVSRKTAKFRSAQKSPVSKLSDETFSKALCKAINDQADARKKAMNFGQEVAQQNQTTNATESISTAGEFDYMALSKIFFAGMASGVVEKLKISNTLQRGNLL